MGDFGLFVACWGGKCFTARVCVWCRGGKCFTARLGVLCWGVVSFVPVMVPRLVREKILPARLVGDKNGTKLSQQEENVPNRAILGEQGEFYTENAAARLALGEFCTASGTARLVQGEFCTGTGAARLALGEFCTASGTARRVQGEFCTGTGGVRGLLAPETVRCPVWRSRVLEGPSAS